MNDEIKEILEMLRKYGSTNDKVLLDYITNLQIIEREYSAILSENAELQQENERLKEEKDNLYLDNTMIKLEKDIYKQGYEDFKNLIDTLQNGSDSQ